MLLIQPQWDVTPPPPACGPPATNHASCVPTKLEKPTTLLSPAPRFPTSLSPPPSTQPRHPTQKRGVATWHWKPTLVKKTAVDQFNDSCQEESRHLSLKRKMEHDEKMALFRLKRHKYDLWYGSIPQTPDSLTPLFATAVMTAEDKQIEILCLQIRLAELNWDNSAHSLSSQIPHARAVSRCHLKSHMPHHHVPCHPIFHITSKRC